MALKTGTSAEQQPFFYSEDELIFAMKNGEVHSPLKNVRSKG